MDHNYFLNKPASQVVYNLSKLQVINKESGCFWSLLTKVALS